MPAVKTDLPLKRLTQLRPADLLYLLRSPEAEVVAVESLELPASTTSLDTVLRLRRPDGTEYLHLIEWQGYRDPQFLWRTLGYLSWLGQNRRERPILVTIVYLHPGDDIGDTLIQEIP
jgi:predicted transposase YdaD